MFFYIIILLLTFAYTIEDAQASEFTGLAAFAAMNPRFPCDAYLRSQSSAPRPGMVVVWGTFGYDATCVARFIERFSDRPHLLQIHLSNEVCRRNKRCKEFEVRPHWNIRRYNQALDSKDSQLFAELTARVQFIRHFVETLQTSNTTVVLSAGLEDNYSISAFRNLLELLRAEWPGLISRNPLRPESGRLGADFIEAHLLDYDFNGEPCIATQDGVLGSFRHSEQFIRNFSNQCFATFLWRAETQGAAQRVWTPPLKRKFRLGERQVRELRTLFKFAEVLKARARI